MCSPPRPCTAVSAHLGLPCPGISCLDMLAYLRCLGTSENRPPLSCEKGTTQDPFKDGLQGQPQPQSCFAGGQTLGDKEWGWAALRD